MSSCFGNKVAMAGALFALFIAGCASVPKTTTSVRPLVPSFNAMAISAIRSQLEQESLKARSLYATGDITVDQNGESNSASFSMKSKRLGRMFGAHTFDSHQPSYFGAERVDSLSIEISGPFGIKVARFLASPEKYEFYDILHGQTLEGKTDQQSLENLTHLNGISLQSMSDLIYGLAQFDSSSGDSIQLYSNNAHQFALVIREAGIATSAYDFEGTLPGDSTAGNVHLTRYRRWQGTPASLSTPPAVDIQFSEPLIMDGVSVPEHIEATAGQNKLILQYDHAELNPSSLIVKIKMP